MNNLTEWLVKPFIKEEFGAPAGILPSPSQEKRKKAKKKLDRSVYSEIDENLDEAKQKLKLNIPADIKKIHKLFKKNRKQLYVVGGAVRDAILGNTPKDFDLVTDAKPDEVLKIAKQGGFKTVEVGKSFGVVVVNGHEIATFRKDIGKGRRPDAVDFTDIKGDVKRRDLTINALFYDIDKHDIVDLVGGIKDLKKKQIRTVGLADARFDEDPLRKLRAVRFSSTIGGRIHSDTLSALKKNPSLRGVSAERIRDEFVKSLSKAKSPSKYLKLVHNLKMLQQILPGLNINKKFINSKDYIVQLSYLLKDNDSSKLGNKLNSLRYTTKESTNVSFLVSLQNFKSEEIYTYKKFQEKTSLTMAQIKEYGKLIGNEKDVVKMAKFKLSIKSKDVSKDLKGPEIGKAIKTKEKEKFLNEIAVRKKPKTFRDIYNALPSDLKKRVMNLKNYQQRKDAHPEGNVLKHTIAVTNRALKTGDIDFALSALFHDIGKDSTAKLHPKKGFWTHYGHEHVSAKLVKKHDKWIKSMGGNTLDIYWIVKQHMRMKVFDKMKWQKQDKMKKFRAFGKLKKFSKDFDKGGRGMSDSKIIEKKLDSYMESFVYSVSEIDKKLPKIKKVVGIYGGRFQPFGPHHKKTYEWLKKQVDEVYITTSNIKQPPRHPMNFTEKVRHMVKMGIPKNRIVQERSPYVAKNTLSKYDKDTTAVIYMFGAKDAGRLSGGKYFQDYKKNKNKMNGYEENGYVLTAPHSSIKVAGKEVSGTVMRDLLGSPKYEKNREKIFRQAFGYFDKNIFNMMNNSFKKLYEFVDNNLDRITDIIKESSVMAGSPVDDGPPTFHISFNDYKSTSKDWLEKDFEGLGWQVINYIISDNAKDPLLDFSIRLNTVPAISYGNLNTSKEVAIAKYKKNIENRVLNNVGFEIIKWFGLKDDFSETTGVDVAQPVLPGKHNAEKNTDLKESFNLDDEIKFLLEVDGMLLEEGVKFNNFLKDWAKKAKQPLDKVRKTMMNKNTFSIAKLNDFSVDKVLDSAKKGFKAYQKVLNYVPDKIAKKLSKTKFGEKKEKYLKKLDNYLQKNPKLKRVMGVAAAAGVTYAWTKMSFIGDPEYDLDLSAAATAAAAGDYSMADLFSGEMGTKFLILTAVGATTGLTAPYTKILGSVGTMAAGVTFGAIKAYKAHKKKKADAEKKAKTSTPDTVKNPNPKGRKKTIGRQSAVRWVAKNKGSKAAQKYSKSLSETKLFTPDWWIQELDLNPRKEKELLLMGGAAGHMSHPFDDNHLTFGDFKNIIDMSLEGKLSREDNVTEKLDGQNLMVSWVDGELRGARNKGHLKMFGKTSLNIAGMKSLFSGRGDIEKAFVGSMKDLENAIGKLSDKQKEKIFGNGSKWMNLEIVYPATANVIDYDVSELFFHGSIEINEDGTVKGAITDSARMLEGMIRQANANIQKRFKISKPVVLNLPKVQDFSKKKKYFLSKLRKLQTIYNLKDNDTLGMYHEMYWREYIFNAAKQKKYRIPRNILEALVKRWAYFNKSFRLDKKSIKHEKFLGWTKGVDKFDHKKLAYENIKPFELLFLELGAEILKNLDGFLAVNPKKAVQKIKKDLKSAISGLRRSKDIKNIDLLKKNLNKINSIGGTSAVIPSEGLVFKYKGNMYKFTGAFAPVNQILGALKFSR